VTLVVSLAAGALVLQVGDRLLTKGGSEWDALANKSVVLLGRDGYACLSYSGAAYIAGIPTDQWLANVISERDTSATGSPAMLVDASLVLNVGPALARVRAAIELEFGSRGARYRPHGIAVEVTGFIGHSRRSPRVRVRPFMQRYYHRGRRHPGLVADELPRHWNWGREYRVGGIGAAWSDAKRALIQELQLPLRRNQDDVESLLASTIRSVRARGNKTVGQHCMSVVMSQHGSVRVRFLPDPNDDDGVVAYTPWVIGHGGLWPPSELYGAQFTFHAGGYDVQFDRIPPTAQRLPAGAHAQKRKEAS
jgi:hypothetical protein